MLRSHSGASSMPAIPGTREASPRGPLQVATNEQAERKHKDPAFPWPELSHVAPQSCMGAEKPASLNTGWWALPQCLFLRTFVGRPGRRRCQESKDIGSGLTPPIAIVGPASHSPFWPRVYQRGGELDRLTHLCTLPVPNVYVMLLITTVLSSVLHR